MATAPVILRGAVIDMEGTEHRVDVPPVMLCPALGGPCSLPRWLSRMTSSPSSIKISRTLSLGRSCYRWSSSLAVNAHAGQEPGVAMHARDDVDLWHRRLGHIGAKGLDSLQKVDGNGVNVSGSHFPCDFCTLGKRKQQPHPKTTDYNITRPFQVVFRDIMVSSTATALGNYANANKINDEHTKWRSVCLTKGKGLSRSSFRWARAFSICVRTRAVRTSGPSSRATASALA